MENEETKLAKAMHAAYAAKREEQRGDRVPTFANLNPEERNAWLAAAKVAIADRKQPPNDGHG